MKINEQFTAIRDEWCWNLAETYMAKDKDGNPKEAVRTTYHANLSQVFDCILDKQLGDASEIKQFAEIVANAKADMSAAINHKARDQLKEIADLIHAIEAAEKLNERAAP